MVVIPMSRVTVSRQKKFPTFPDKIAVEQMHIY